MTPATNNDATDGEVQHVAALAKLADAKAAEKEARRLRSAGKDEEAIAAYDRAKDLYDDSDLAWHERGESKLAESVRKAIKRCDTSVSNIRHPKEKRAPATTSRPNCLACGKPLRRFRWYSKFADGTPREWGSYGDHRFCGLKCGWRWACSHAPMPKEREK